MTKYGFYFNQDDCVGCKACQVACKDKNDLPIGTLFRTVTDYESGSFPSVGVFHYAATCNHCADPACVAACSKGAMFINTADGTVQHDDTLCDGCKACVNACPYGVPKYFADINQVHKCDACFQLRENGEQPACVAACQTRCLEFGDVEELAKKHAGTVKELPFLPDSALTNPSTLISAKECAKNTSYTQIYL